MCWDARVASRTFRLVVVTNNRKVVAVTAIAKSFVKGLFFLALLYALFRYVGEFSERESVVLAMVAWIGYGLYERLNIPRVETVFTPFRVSFFPNWYELLLDFKLIKDKEDWKRLCEAEDKLPASQFRVFKQGFSFSVVQPPSDEGLMPGLTFWDNRKVFIGELELSEPIIEKEGDRWAFGRFGEKHEFFDCSAPRSN